MEIEHWWWLYDINKPVEMAGPITREKSDQLLQTLRAAKAAALKEADNG